MRRSLRPEAGMLWAVTAILALAAPVAAVAGDPAPPPADTRPGQPLPAAEPLPEACGPSPEAAPEASAPGPAAEARVEPPPFPVAAPVQTSELPECGHGRAYDGCCGFGWSMESRWKCASFCCVGNQCGLLCEETWCEGPCIL